MDNIATINTGIANFGHNFQNYVFQNGEEYRLYFYPNQFDDRVSMSIYDELGNPLIENRELTVTDDLCPDVSELKGRFYGSGDPFTVSSTDNTSNLFYTYRT